MNFSRRDFLKGSVALAEFSALGSFAFALPAGWRPKKNPKLVFGVLADTHIRSDSEWHSGKKSDKFLVSALEYFRTQNVDAVVHCGDMADRGLVDELQFHADAWYRVFPGNRAPDGHIVEKLFVTGNHDIDSWYRDIDMTQFVPEKKEWSEKIINEDVARHWKRIWGEEYNLLWHKSVKGYPFSRNELQKIIGCPQFRKGAKMTVKMSNEASSKELIIKIPHADGNPKTRVYAYEVVVSGNKKSEKLVKAVYAAGCNMSIDKTHGGGVTVLGIPMSEMPGGDRYVINVRPITSLGTFGKSIRKVVAI